MKYLSNFKKIVLVCVKNKWLKEDPFVRFKMSPKEMYKEPLSADELRTITAKGFSINRIGQVRDIFLFCCYTGLAYTDIKNLKKSEIVTGIDGGLWVCTHREKTGVPSRIPLLPQALKIIDKYQSFPLCEKTGNVLRVLSNQKMNAYLKEVADLCGITKPVTFHTARHTFATTVMLTNGVPIETASQMMGNKSLSQTQHYAKDLDVKVSEDMNALRNRLSQIE